MVDPAKAFALIVLNLVVLWFQPTFQQQRLTSGVERAALFQLRSDLGIRSREWPRKSEPCQSWAGVTCVNGTVTEINISGFRRTRLGSLNPQFAVEALANFTKLTSFNASKFLLPGSIPDSFGQMMVSSTSLQILDLSSCDITNAVPSSLGDLSSLSQLHLGGNRLTGIIPSSLGQLLQLSVLNLSRNLFTGSIPSSFVNLVNLTSLDMSSNFLAGSIPPIGGSALRSLNFSNNSLSSFQFGSLVGLVDLDLTSNSLSGSLPVELSGMSSLKSLLLGNNLFGGPLPSGLFVANQTQLQNVVLSNNDFTGSVPGELLSIPGLRLLDISSNNFTGMLLDSSNSNANANTTAAVLNISGNQFYGGLGPALRRFSFVDLSGNYFQGPVPNYVISNASLGRNCLRNVTDQKSLFDCSSFYSSLGLTFDNFGLPNSTQPDVRKKSKRNLIILVSVLGGIGLLLLIFFVVVLVFCLRKRGTSNQRGVAVEPAPTGTGMVPPPPEASINFSILGDTFTYQQLLQATGEFNDANLIKRGHSGDIFRGILENGTLVAIKRIDLGAIKKESYLVELDFFSKVAHAKVVPLLGHCLENENEKLLVYKYMPNGDLASSLFRKTSSEDDTLKSLDWITRLKIAIGAAEALSCLHHECTPPIVHRDIQASSILLDDKFEVRLGSLSEVCAQEGDAHQSRITRLLRLPSSDQGTSAQPSATCTYDVYCFGKVLLELVTGNLGISAANEAQLKEYLDQIIPHISMYEKELVVKIVDPSLMIDEDLLEEVWAMAIVATSCLNPKPSRRPLMRYILKALENPLKVVREEAVDSSARLRTTSSRGSWNAAVFSSWRQSSDVTVVQPGQAGGVGSSSRPEGVGGGSSSLKQSGTSSGGGRNGSGSSSSHRRGSRDIFPEPGYEQDVERQLQHD